MVGGDVQTVGEVSGKRAEFGLKGILIRKFRIDAKPIDLHAKINNWMIGKNWYTCKLKP